MPREQACGRPEAERESDPGPTRAAAALPGTSTLKPRVGERLLLPPVFKLGSAAPFLSGVPGEGPPGGHQLE